MMEVGNGMTVSEDRAHFSMWAMLAAPLLAGNDLRTMSPETTEILTNREVIAVDQDSLGIQGMKYLDAGDLEIWFRPLTGGDWAMALLNRAGPARQVDFDWSHEPVRDDMSGHDTAFSSTRYRLRDLWSGEDLGTTDTALAIEVPAHDVRMLRLIVQESNR
jgi:alpha-galactosidase